MAATVVIKVTSQKPASFYIRSAATFLRGTEDKPPVKDLEISALGNAIPAAIQVANAMEKSELCAVTGVKTNYSEMEAGSKTVSVPQLSISLISKASSPQFEAVGGHDDSIVFEGSLVWKKMQGGERGDSEAEFIEKAVSVAGLSDFVPKFNGFRTMGDSKYLGMSNLLAGLQEPAIIDLKIGTQTWSPSASPEKIASQSAKAAKSTTGKLGVRLVGGKLRLQKDGDWVKIGYKNDKDVGTEEELTKELGQFLCSPALREQTASQLEKLSAWFATQREFAFYASSLLLAYDTAALPTPTELRFGMIDFAHVEACPEGGDQSYITGLESMKRMIANLMKA